MLLLAYDGSPTARRALQHAARLVGRGGEIAVVNVIPAQSVSSRLETVTEDERDQQARTLREANDLLVHRGIEPELIEAVGDPATEILDAAEKRNAELIVIGRSDRRHLARGALDTRLVRNAAADVLVVP
jgi:nucleotide-binding universal stress UspA family protein